VPRGNRGWRGRRRERRGRWGRGRGWRGGRGRGRRDRHGRRRKRDELRARAASSEPPIEPPIESCHHVADRPTVFARNRVSVHRPRLRSSEHREYCDCDERARRIASPRRPCSTPSPPDAPPRCIVNVARHRRGRLALPGTPKRASRAVPAVPEASAHQRLSENAHFCNRPNVWTKCM
jgi:hypothetical protein